MAHTEKTIASQTLFEGRIIEVRKDKVELENGRQSTRELVLHHGGVCVAALDEQDRILLVRQFRYPYGKEIIELPAGKIEKGARLKRGRTRANAASASCRRSAAAPPTALKS